MTDQEKLEQAYEAGRSRGRSEAFRDAHDEMRARFRHEADFWKTQHNELMDRVSNYALLNLRAPAFVVNQRYPMNLSDAHLTLESAGPFSFWRHPDGSRS